MLRPMGFLFLLLLFTLLVVFAHDGWANERRGRALFQLCAACHGNRGEGRIDLAAPAIAGLPEWYIVAQLTKFRDGARGRHPQDIAGMRMRPMARSLPNPEDVRSVATYVANLSPHSLPPTISGDVTSGQTQYLVCTACHGPDGRGNEQLMAPPLVITSDWYLLTQLQNFKHRVRGADATKDISGAMMMPMASGLDEQQMKDVIAYIQTLR